MAYHNGNTFHAIPLYTPAHRVFGPNALDQAIYAYRQARNACDFTLALSRAYADLARANRVLPALRRDRRAAAFRAINALRAQRRAAWVVRDRAEVVLFAAGSSAAVVDAQDAARRLDADLAPFTGVSIADDSDMAAFLPRGGAVSGQVAR